MSYLIFRDQRILMNYFRQPVGPETYEKFKDGLQDSMSVLAHAMLASGSREETATGVAQAAIELIFNTVGLLHALGLDPQPLWDEAHRANVDLIKHPCTECNGQGSTLVTVEDAPVQQACPVCRGQRYVYEVRRGEDNKFLAPTGWLAPQMAPLVHAMLNPAESP